LRVEQAARALDDEVEQPLGLQLGRELALDVGERLDLRAPALLEGEQARVFEGDRRLARERRQELDLVRRECRTVWPAAPHRAVTISTICAGSRLATSRRAVSAKARMRAACRLTST